MGQLHVRLDIHVAFHADDEGLAGEAHLVEVGTGEVGIDGGFYIFAVE